MSNLKNTPLDTCKDELLSGGSKLKEWRSVQIFRRVLIVCSLVGTAAASPLTINLQFGQLPSAVGWQYGGTIPETTAIHVVPAGLEMNSMGGPFGQGAAYSMLGVVGTDPITFNFRMKVVASEGSFGWGPEVDTGTTAYTIQFSTTTITAYTFGSIPFDTTAFHDYRWVVQPGVGYSLYIDGSSSAALTGGVLSDTVDANGLLFGDFTGFGNADVILAAPEPAAITLCMIGFVALIFATPIAKRASA